MLPCRGQAYIGEYHLQVQDLSRSHLRAAALRSFTRALIVLVAMLAVAAPATAYEEGRTPVDYRFSNGDFTSHGSKRNRALKVTAGDYVIQPGTVIFVSHLHPDSVAMMRDTQGVVDRIALSVDAGNKVLTGEGLLRFLIESDEMSRYEDIRTAEGQARYAKEHTGLLLAFHDSGHDKGGYWFSLRIVDAATSKEVFFARHSVKGGTAFFRWDGISYNEIMNPCFNSFIDWYRANKKRVVQ